MTNAEAWFSIALRPQKPEGSLGRTAQDGHLDSHVAPELRRQCRGISYLCTGTCPCPPKGLDIKTPLKGHFLPQYTCPCPPKGLGIKTPLKGHFLPLYTCPCPQKGLGIKTVEATQRQSMHVNIMCIHPRLKTTTDKLFWLHSRKDVNQCLQSAKDQRAMYMHALQLHNL